MQIDNRKQNYIRIFFVYLAASLFIGVPYALLSGVWPKNITGWVLIFIFGLPSLILGEFIGEKLYSDKISQKIDKEYKDQIISIKRMGYALVVSFVIGVIIILIGFLLRVSVGDQFIKDHFNVK